MTTRWILRATVITAAAAWLSAACAQFDGPTERPPVKVDADAKLEVPKVDVAGHSFSLPAAFWNQHMADWVEVALCGRPSEFLHETIMSVFTTRQKMLDAARAAGFRDADYWVSNVADFPRIRGDRAMLLLEVEMGGKKEIFPLDELLAYQGWGVTIGPFGWMFKGDPERESNGAAPPPEPGAPPAQAADEVLGDDPQIALQFKGIQHLSRSFMDHPLCYDKWIYPVVRYQRNYSVQPAVLAVPDTVSKFWEKVYDSNGEIKVTLTITKVSEEEFLNAMATHWHEAKYAAYIRAQLPVAKQIDADKAELEKQVLAIRALLKKGTAREDVMESDAFAGVALFSAKVEKGYCALDAAWVAWSADHPVYQTQPGDDRGLDELKERAKLWREHMTDWKEKAAYLEEAEQARFDLRPLKGHEKEKGDAILALRGKELAARSHAALLEGKHVLRYWKYEESRLTPDEIRTDWIRNIKTQLEFSRAQEELANAGIELGEAMQKGDMPKVDTAKSRYAKALLRVTVADLNARLADLEFQISKYADDDPALPPLKKQRAVILKQLEEMNAATKPN